MVKIKIAIPTGDPAGIGPEIALKAALDPAVRAACDPILVSDPDLLERHAKACGIDRIRSDQRAALPATGNRIAAASASSARSQAAPRSRSAPPPSKAAMAGEVDAVVAAPQHETSIAQAGITFDGHPSFVARQTGTDENGVYMMLCVRRDADRALHLAPERARGDRADHDGERGAHHPRYRRGAEAARHRQRRKSR